MSRTFPWPSNRLSFKFLLTSNSSLWRCSTFFPKNQIYQDGHRQLWDQETNQLPSDSPCYSASKWLLTIVCLLVLIGVSSNFPKFALNFSSLCTDFSLSSRDRNLTNRIWEECWRWVESDSAIKWRSVKISRLCQISN